MDYTTNHVPIYEQWKREGNCSLCRRIDFCEKACKASRTRAVIAAVESEIKKEINENRKGDYLCRLI